MVAKEDATVLDFDPFEGKLEDATQLHADRTTPGQRAFPVPLKEELRILGVQLGNLLTMDSQFHRMLSKAQWRQAILNKVARC